MKKIQYFIKDTILDYDLRSLSLYTRKNGQERMDEGECGRVYCLFRVQVSQKKKVFYVLQDESLQVLLSTEFRVEKFVGISHGNVVLSSCENSGIVFCGSYRDLFLSMNKLYQKVYNDYS